MEKISIINASFRNGSIIILPHTTWTIHHREHWAILGPNGAGKSTLVKALWGGTSLVSGRIEYPFITENPVRFETLRNKIGYVSFELHQNFIKKEALFDEMREYAGTHEHQTTVQMLIRNDLDYSENEIQEIAKYTGITDLLTQPIRSLSSGQFRKALIARALLKKPEFLILDEPYDSLDSQSREDLTELITSIHKKTQIILVTHRIEEIHPCITHVMMIEKGKVIRIGTKKEVLTSQNLHKLYRIPVSLIEQNGIFHLNYNLGIEAFAHEYKQSNPYRGEVISCNNVSLSYREKLVFSDLSWNVQSGENWLIKGDNGSGKSSIVQLITGDNLQVYSKDIRLFGKKRGPGSSLWELKKRIGIVSGEVQLRPNLQRLATVEDWIISGFYQSFGLYQQPTTEQKNAARTIAEQLGCSHLLKKPFEECSNGQKRIVLFARALVHEPDLLILDEPCHGLDIPSRYRVLSHIQKLTKSTVTLVMTTHHDDEIVPGITNVLLHNPECKNWNVTTLSSL